MLLRDAFHTLIDKALMQITRSLFVPSEFYLSSDAGTRQIGTCRDLHVQKKIEHLSRELPSKVPVGTQASILVEYDESNALYVGKYLVLEIAANPGDRLNERMATRIS